MGKTKKTKNTGDKSQRNAPLTHQILEDPTVRAPGRTKTRKRQEDDEEFVNERLSRRILEQARLQQAQLEDEHGVVSKSQPARGKPVKLGGASAQDEDAASESDEDLSETGDQYEEIEVDPEDEVALQMFMSAAPPVKRTLADIIMEKITEKQTEIRSQMSENASVQMEELDERVVNMYKQIRGILSKYRSGKLPKAFKIIPSLTNWEQILYLTDPECWTAAAMYQATRIFASNLNGRMAQRFFNLVLYPRIRDDIAEYRRLNFHLYMAMKKSLFKPGAFFRGILLPLCQSGTCTLREAVIVSSVLAKCSIPIAHSSAAICKIAEMEYNGANSIFLRTLLDKKYALAHQAVDAVVYHFLRFRTDKRQLPVLWHQCLLVFAQRYKESISTEQKEALLELLRAHTHEKITPEIRREIVNAKCRDVEITQPRDMEEDL